MQIFVSDKGYVFIDAMKSVSEFTKALNFFAKEVGVPEAIITDCHKKIQGFSKFTDNFHCSNKYIPFIWKKNCIQV